MKKILVALLFAYMCSGAYAFTLSDYSFSGLASVYGYLHGQERMLNLIEISHPELRRDVLIARARFNSAYPDVKIKVADKIIELGGEKARGLINKLNLQIEGGEIKVISTDEAIEFLRFVKSGADGDIKLEKARDFMLAVAFYENPKEEFLRGNIKIFNTSNEDKAKGLSLSIKLPISWAERSGNMPNSIRTWQSEVGSGKSLISFLVYESGDTRAKAQVKGAIERLELKNMVHPAATINKISYAEISNQPGWYVESEIVQQKLDLSVYLVSKQVYALYRGKTIELGCASGGLLSKKEEVIKEAKRIEGLCRAILASLVINDVYK